MTNNDFHSAVLSKMNQQSREMNQIRRLLEAVLKSMKSEIPSSHKLTQEVTNLEEEQ